MKGAILNMEHQTIQTAQITAFKQYLHSEERVSGTINKYLRDVRAFAAWLGERPLDKEACTLWKEQLQAEKLCPETVNSKFSVEQILQISPPGRLLREIPAHPTQAVPQDGTGTE